jgi:hypothetical protein
MQTIEIQTLVDITETNVIRPNQGTPLAHNQQRNFTTLKQCVEIRSNIMFDGSPVVEERDIKDMGFGTKYKGKHRVWTFVFSPERSGAYSDIKVLGNDINQVPVIQKLTETINMDTSIFEITDPVNTNTIIKIGA